MELTDRMVTPSRSPQPISQRQFERATELLQAHADRVQDRLDQELALSQRVRDILRPMALGEPIENWIGPVLGLAKELNGFPVGAGIRRNPSVPAMTSGLAADTAAGD